MAVLRMASRSISGAPCSFSITITFSVQYCVYRSGQVATPRSPVESRYWAKCRTCWASCLKSTSWSMDVRMSPTMSASDARDTSGDKISSALLAM